MDQEKDKKGAAVGFPPPLVFLIVMLVAYVIHLFWPLTLPFSDALIYLGVTVLILSLLLLANLFLAFRRVKTHIEPWKPTSHIITTGIFAYSRNPIYLVFCLINIGFALMVSSVWLLISVFPSAYFVYLIAIKKEEIYLAEKFGEEYLDYKRQVRRWL